MVDKNRIPTIKHIEPYFKIAQEEAKKSPCERRQFGAVIVLMDNFPYFIARHNQRVSTCCEGICARDRVQLRNGERVEIGAEVHAETAAIIAYHPPKWNTSVLILAAYAGERELLGTEVYPCHTCALNLKYADIKWAYMKNLKGLLEPITIAEVIEYREAEWEPDV